MNHFDLNQKVQSEHDLKKIIFDMFEMCVFQQTVGHFYEYRAPLLIDLFLCSYEVDS